MDLVELVYTGGECMVREAGHVLPGRIAVLEQEGAMVGLCVTIAVIDTGDGGEYVQQSTGPRG